MRDSADLVEVIAQHLQQSQPLELIGHGTKRGWGRPVAAAQLVDLNALSGVIDYEPGELVLTAAAATPMAQLGRLVAAKGQRFAFDPPDFGPLYGEPADRASLGGVIGCNLSGSRRLTSGAARDHILGFAAVNGRAEAFKAGGKVVKNVTGYDLAKLLTGSFGTLAALTEITVKLAPQPETEQTVILFDQADSTGLEALRAALNTAHDPSALAHLPKVAASALGLAGAASLARIEGFAPSIAVRVQAIVELWRQRHAKPTLTILEAAASHRLWQQVAAATALAQAPDLAAWRVSLPPTEGAGVALVLADLAQIHWYDWAGGLLWLGIAPRPDLPDAGAARIRACAAAAGGHATLLRAPAAIRTDHGVFQPLAPGLEALERRVKAGFDPHGILNPGRIRM